LSTGERILIVRVGALGDTLMATPVLRALKATFPEAELDVLCARSLAPLLERSPAVERLFALRHRNLPYALSIEKRRLVRALRARGYALAVLLETAPRYRALVERAGVAEIRSFRETPFDPGSHAIVNNLRAAGVDAGGAGLDMEVHLSERDRDRARELLAAVPAPRVGIHLGYGPRGKKRGQSERLKGWPLERFAALGAALLARGSALVFTGAPEDVRDVGAVVSALPPGGAIANLAGRTTVGELAAVIERTDVFVSVDSGPAHLAAALKRPLVVLWGPAVLEHTRPLSSRSPVTILRHPPPCAPCYGTPLMKTCRRNICMEAIEPDEVLQAVTRTLASGDARAH
jgi:ADP-heptose:LPS heptosyltransferase